MRKKSFSLMVVPHDKSPIHSVTLSFPWILASIAISVLSLSFFAYCTVGYYRKSIRTSEMKRLRAENTRLLKRVKEIESNLAQLRTEMEKLAEENDELRTVMDLPQIDPDVRMMGIGGLLLGSGNTILSSPAEAYAEKVELDIDQLLRQAKLEKTSFEEIRKKFLAQRERLDHTPSIIPAAGYLSSGFGWRKDPFTGRRAFHCGVDISGQHGTPVYATADGRVRKVQYLPRSFGKLVVVDHGYGYETVYAHLSRITVRRGQGVKRGEKIGEMGNTGRSTGTHLHYEVKVNGRPVNPLRFFYAQTYVGS
ncbi:MAG: peptidoglycan DD-metalloendopeptidase family protein [Candidatus Latescibacteria bacterium]|nr:peptidoglycan DD-metalloendopeptidase family protein [Candidatus Latescibacterota bacterium]